METVRIDAAFLTQREEAMDTLEEALNLPAWWGRNLDALHDCLTEVSLCLELENAGSLEESPFGRSLLRLLAAAAEENPGFFLETDE